MELRQNILRDTQGSIIVFGIKGTVQSKDNDKEKDNLTLKVFVVRHYLFLSVSSRMGRFRLPRLGAKHIRNRAFLSGRLREWL